MARKRRARWMVIGLVFAGLLAAMSAQPAFAQCKPGQSTFSFADAEHSFTGVGQQCYAALGGMTSIQISALGAASAKAPFGRDFDTRAATLAKSAAIIAPPNTPAGAQLGWLLAAIAHLPIPDPMLRAHFDAALVAQVSPAVLNQALEGLRGARLVRLWSVDRAAWCSSSRSATANLSRRSNLASTARG